MAFTGLCVIADYRLMYWNLLLAMSNYTARSMDVLETGLPMI